MSARVRKRIQVRGTVQGVGFDSGKGPRRTAGFGGCRRRSSMANDGLAVAIKGLAGHYWACDGGNAKCPSVRRVRESKRRSDETFTIMVRDVHQVERLSARLGK